MDDVVIRTAVLAALWLTLFGVGNSLCKRNHEGQLP
jgi:hypothetical protein